MNSPIKVSRRKKLDALNLVARGQKLDEVANSISISKATIKRAKRKQQLYGDIEGGKRKRGPKALFTPAIINVSSISIPLNEQVLLSMIHKVPSAYLDEYLKELKDRFGLTVKQPQLSKLLANMGINRKKVFSSSIILI